MRNDRSSIARAVTHMRLQARMDGSPCTSLSLMARLKKPSRSPSASKIGATRLFTLELFSQINEEESMTGWWQNLDLAAKLRSALFNFKYSDRGSAVMSR